MTAPERIWITDGWTRRWHHEPFAGDPGEQYVRFYLYTTLAAKCEALESDAAQKALLSQLAAEEAERQVDRAEALAARIRELEALVRALVQAAADCNPAQGDDIRSDPAVLEARALLARMGGEHDRS